MIRRALVLTISLLVGMTAVVSANAMPRGEPVTIQVEHDRNYGSNRPWLDPTCYDDDHTYDFYAAGWLNIGETWTHNSPLVVCNDKIVKARAWHKAGTFALELIDYGRHPVPERVTREQLPIGGWRIFHRSCNTDLGVEHVHLDEPNDEGDVAYPVTWSVTNTGSRAAYVEVSGLIGEPPWQGGEGSYDDCIHP